MISNGVVNLCPDKPAVFREMHQVLKSGSRHEPDAKECETRGVTVFARRPAGGATR